MLSKSDKILERRRQDDLDLCHEMTRELVRMHGGKRDCAYHDIARATGLSPRRIRSHYEQTVPLGTIDAGEKDALTQCLLDASRAEAARAAHRHAVWAARFGTQPRVASNDGAAAVCQSAQVA